jgi:hypothetical protein
MTADVLKELLQEMDWVMRTFRDELNTDERVWRPLQEARDTIKMRYDDAKDLV